LDSSVSIPDRSTEQLVIFRLGDRTYGIDLGTVREIIPYRRATRLPGAPPYVAGLVNVRGSILTVIDLGLQLGVERDADVDGPVVLVEHGTKVVGVVVDQVVDVVRAGGVDFEIADADGMAGGALRALGRQGQRVVVMLDIGELIRQVLL
jgi:purine-binding chemotaxis protein CheW